MPLEEQWGWLTNRPGTVLNQFLTTNGEPDGTRDATGNYLSAPQDFFISPPEGAIYETLALNVYLTAALTPAPNKGHYGEVGAALANGIEFIFKRGENEQVLNPGGPFKCLADLVFAGARLQNTGLNGAAQSLYVFRFEFLEDYARSLPLHGSRNESFRVRLNDNLTGLDTHIFSVNGVRKALHRDLQL
jgi:hypothetical protein